MHVLHLEMNYLEIICDFLDYVRFCLSLLRRSYDENYRPVHWLEWGKVEKTWWIIKYLFIYLSVFDPASIILAMCWLKLEQQSFIFKIH